MSDITQIGVRENMNQMYRWIRYVYDITRKYYLFGRDDLIKSLEAKRGQKICEVGCGTARNLIKLKKKYPHSYFYGIDISDEMLKTAKKSIKKSKLENAINIAQANADDFDLKTLFHLEKPYMDKVIFSYALSIIPTWRTCIDHALDILEIGGEVHIVDFASSMSHPLPIRKFMRSSLKMFHVYFKTGIEAYLQDLEREGKGILIPISLNSSRANYSIFRKI